MESQLFCGWLLIWYRLGVPIREQAFSYPPSTTPMFYWDHSDCQKVHTWRHLRKTVRCDLKKSLLKDDRIEYEPRTTGQGALRFMLTLQCSSRRTLSYAQFICSYQRKRSNSGAIKTCYYKIAGALPWVRSETANGLTIRASQWIANLNAHKRSWS